jgi:cytochrome c553
MRLGFVFWLIFVPSGTWMCPAAFSASSSAIEFTRDVRPILREHCFSCHGSEKQKSGLRLDRKKEALLGGDSGLAIQPRKSSESLLIRLVSGKDPDRVMPPKGDRLKSEQIAVLEQWIDSGANWPDDGSQEPGKTGRDHWAFRAPVRPPVPSVKNNRWIRNAIDHFILAKLEPARIKPSPEADRSTLIRRLWFDLLGLPPTPEAVDSFLRDTRPDAYERLVDRVLMSPHFGERWGRHWLDLARYADSDGYQVDKPRPTAYLFRDWVIDSINRDLPFDQFTIEQLAGDLLPEASVSQRVAAGFHRNTLWNNEDGIDQEEFRCKAKVDRVATTGTVWLGLTLGCAECHNHKYDPISQREFYQLYAFFNQSQEADVSAPEPVALARHQLEKQTWEQERTRLEAELGEAKQNSAGLTPAGVEERIKKLSERLQQHTSRTPPAYSPPVALSFAMKPEARTFVHVRGDFLRKGDEVQPGTPAVLHALKARDAQADRLDLARWMIDPANPLTARVAVNHVWQHLFGRGLVNTPEDFGTRGERPSHPELLDWLAVEFMKNGWSRKSLIRLVVTSATYRQHSFIRPELAQKDPENILLARQNRFRLEAEIIRDLYLASAGLLNAAIGGPSFRPHMPDDVKALGSAGGFQWVDSDGPERFRRGLYIYNQRTVPYPVLMTFDFTDAKTTCTRRERSNTPLQALTLLNNEVFVNCARGLGKQLADHKGDAVEAIRHAFQLCLARAPAQEELERVEKLFHTQLALAQKNPATWQVSQGFGETAESAAWFVVAQTLLNLDEFITRE